MLGTSNGLSVVHVEVCIVVGEPLNSRTATSTISIALTPYAIIGEDGTELGLGVTIAKVIIRVEASKFSAFIMVASLHERKEG